MLGEARRHGHQGQGDQSEREEQQQRRRQPALEPASEQEFAQRPRGNGQDRAEQDRGGEGQQHRQNAEKQTAEEQEQDGVFKELRGAGRCGIARCALRRREFICHGHRSPPDASRKPEKSAPPD